MISIASRVRAVQKSEQPLECVQEQGDLIFVPDFWGHGVLNLAESIGFASEFLWGSTEFTLLSEF